MTHVFISYARKDGSDEAERLFNDLKKHGIEAWWDAESLDPFADFGGKIEQGILKSTHVAVCVTPDVRRENSFVRREIAFALEEQKPIIPLVFTGGRRPITIINHTYIDFSDWDTGMAQLLERLKRGVETITPETQRERELEYLQEIARRYDHWRDLYTDLAATATIEQPKVRVKQGAAARYLDMQHDIFEKISHESDAAKTITVESFAELREGIRKYQRVALIGDPGAGKTTTLERMAYELAAEAAENITESEKEGGSQTAPLPLFVRLGAYDGGDFETFLEANFGGLRIRDYLGSPHPHPCQQAALSVPKALERGVFLLLDGLNETPPEHVQKIQDWIQRHDQTPMIVSCRKLDYTGLKLPLQRIDVAPLDEYRIYLFIGNYLETSDQETLFWSLAGNEMKQRWQDWKKETSFEEFWRHKNPFEVNLPGMLGILTNPFLLFITIQIFTRLGEPPKNRGQLFDNFIKLLFEKRGKPASLTRPPWIEEAIQRKALSILAYHMQLEHKGTSADKIWALQVIQKALPRENAEQILYLAASASIIEYGQNVRFVHQLLQEYFAAYEMLEDIRRGVPANHEKYWPSKQWSIPTGWEETAVILAGVLGDATEVVKWLTPVQPILAYQCIKESGSPCDENVWRQLANPKIPPMPAYKNGNEIDEWRKSLPRSNPFAKLAWWQQHIQEDTRPGVGLRADGLPDIDWVEIPAGEFLYGADKQPIFLPTFEIARYPVTWIQYQAFVEASDGYADEGWWDFSEFAAAWRQENPQPQAARWAIPNHPRETVTWYEAVAFCRWLEAKLAPPSIPPSQWGEENQGRLQARQRVFENSDQYAAPLEPAPTYHITLPTEQQWEKAARGTDGRTYPWGNWYFTGCANADEISRNFGLYSVMQTTPVGLYVYGASRYGVLDMSGNVWEWVLNEYNTGEININNISGLRGGAWLSFIENYLRTSCRHRENPDFRNYAIGFRLTRSF